MPKNSVDDILCVTLFKSTPTGSKKLGQHYIADLVVVLRLILPLCNTTASQVLLEVRPCLPDVVRKASKSTQLNCELIHT
jgi:hypothetical protein